MFMGFSIQFSIQFPGSFHRFSIQFPGSFHRFSIQFPGSFHRFSIQFPGSFTNFPLENPWENHAAEISGTPWSPLRSGPSARLHAGLGPENCWDFKGISNDPFNIIHIWSIISSNEVIGSLDWFKGFFLQETMVINIHIWSIALW